MSKYIKLEDAEDKMYQLWEEDTDNKINSAYCFDDDRAIEALRSLPTIEVSEDCISRKALLEKKYKAKDIFDTEYEDWFVFVPTIKNAPSVVPSRAEGEWIDDPKNNEIKYCSNCELGYTKDFLLGMLPYYNPNPQIVEPPYCPNCGAKMKG